MILLDVVFTNAIFTLILVGILLVAYYFFRAYTHLIQKNADEKAQIEKQVTDEKFQLQQQIGDLKGNVSKHAQQMFEQFKLIEIEGIKKMYAEAAEQVAKNLLAEWQVGVEKDLRKDAVNRSMAINLGKISEQLLPFSHHLAAFNPKDARFIGSPIDFIIFDGISDKKEMVKIYFVEVKSGTSQLTPKQKKIKFAVDNHLIDWLPINVGEFNWTVQEEENPEG